MSTLSVAPRPRRRVGTTQEASRGHTRLRRLSPSSTTRVLQLNGTEERELNEVYSSDSFFFAAMKRETKKTFVQLHKEGIIITYIM